MVPISPVERTKISYGVNLSPNIDSIFLSAGVVFHLNSGLRYDLHITLDKCTFRNNIAPYDAHLYLGIFSSCSVSVKDSNFTYANRITEGNPMELVPVVHPARETIGLQASDGDTALAIDVEIVMNVHITENVGGGLFAFLLLEPPQSYLQLRLKKVEVVSTQFPCARHQLLNLCSLVCTTHENG